MRNILLTILALSVQLCMQAQGMKALQISTTEHDIWHVYPSTVTENDNNPLRLKFKSDDVNCTFRSFGTCFNELDWYALQLLPKEEQDKFFHNLFDPKGDLRFTLGRIPMGASDYAAQENFYTQLYHERNEGIGIWDAWYSPDEMPKGEQDLTMEHFTLERDRKAIIPFIKRAMQENPEMNFWCSPWSPPMWMKKSEHYSNRAGYGNGLDVTYPRYTTQFKMEDPILKAHAMYFSRFITEYGKEGIPITGCCYQNEAYTVNYYPNTSWSAEDAGKFNADYLIPYLNEHNPGVKVWLGTLNTDNVNNIETILNTVSTAEGYQGKRLSEMVAGAGFQWEGRNAIATIRKDYPGLEMIQTESECGGGTFDWGAGVHTFELIHHYLKNGCVDYTNWNSILGGNGRGPFMNWWQNALVHINERLPRANGTCTAYYTPEYYAYKHYSHFICKGTKILNKPVDKDLLLVAQRPDGLYVAVVGNEASMERSLKLDIDGHCIDVNVPARSMNTFVVGTEEQINTLSTEEGLKDGEQEYPADNTHTAQIDPTQKYYLYNVKEGKYLNAGGRFGTRPVLDEVGCEYVLEYSDAGNDYWLATPYGNGTHLGWMNVGGISVEQNYYMDSGSSKEKLTFYPTNEENVYAIGINGYYLTYKTSFSIGDLNEGELGWGQQVKDGDNVNEMDGCLWKLVTADERWAQAKEATADSPADVTFACLKNPDFNRLHDGDDVWSQAPKTPGIEADPYREYIGEFSNSENLDAYLDLTHLPAGVYEFSLAGFYRGAGSPATTDENTAVSVYAKGDGEAVTGLLPTWAAGRHEGKAGQGAELEVTDAKGWFVPNNDVSTTYYLGKGWYPRTAVSTTVKDGKLRVGISAPALAGNEKVDFDNLRVKYYPCGDDAALNMEYLNKLNAKIEEANALLKNSSVPAGKEELSAAINAAQKVYNDQPAWAVSQQAIFELEDAMEAFKKVQESGDMADVIKEHKGDISFLLPKITAWTISAGNVVRNEVTGENWDGKSDSQTGLVKVYNGTASTTLSGMPVGTYRLVASVRGPKGNRILASVNGQKESAVVLPGWNIQEASTAPIINMNGVQMTAAAGNTGYNTASNSQGWCWLAAEGKLDKAGDLTLTIASNAGEGQISNVYLYYMDNGDVVTFTEGEKLANTDKTVTADICVSNPNAIIESDAAFTTAAGAAPNNNLVDGSIADLVLFGGYAFQPVNATAANVTLHTNLAANSWAGLCLPFVPEEELAYYQPSLINNTGIIVSTVTADVVPDKPYLVKTSVPLSCLTAHNVELKSGTSLTNTSDIATMTGTYESATVAEGARNYILHNNRLELAGQDTKVAPFGAWLTLNQESEVKAFDIKDGDAIATITVAEACTDGKGLYYSTYSCSKPFIVSNDITVSEVSVVNGKLSVRQYATGAVVPANTGVMVSANIAGDHIVALSENNNGTSVLGNGNMLRPTGDEGISAADMAGKDSGCKFYRLTMHDGVTIGFYYGAEEGAAFDVAANKAYLAVPVAQAAKFNGFALDGSDPTGISSVTDGSDAAGNRAVYNLQGQRVNGNAAKGLYIVNGKKLIKD